MNGIINTFLLAANTFMKCIYDTLDLHIVLVNYLQKSKKKHKNLRK